MYTFNSSTGIVTRNSDGLQIAPSQSIEDTNYVDYVSWVLAGNEPTETSDPVVSINDTNSKSIDYAFNTNNTPFSSKKLGEVYSSLFRFSFSGSLTLGKPSSILVVGNVPSNVNPVKLKLQNVLTGSVIAESASISNTAPAIIDLGSLSNIPETENIFELQAATTSGSAEFHLSSLHIKF